MTAEQIAFLSRLLSDAKITHRDKLIRLTFTITRDMLAASPSRPGPSPPGKVSTPAQAPSR
jgi:hypothetical protein